MPPANVKANMQLGIAMWIGSSPSMFREGPKSIPPIDVAPMRNAIAKLAPTRRVFEKNSVTMRRSSCTTGGESSNHFRKYCSGTLEEARAITTRLTEILEGHRLIEMLKCNQRRCA